MSVQARFVQFSILILFGITSIICSIYFIYHLIKMPSFRKRFQNQTLIILVFIVFLNTIFHIPTTFRFAFFHRNWKSFIRLILVITLVDMLYLNRKFFAIFGNVLIIFLLLVLSGLKRYILLNVIFLYLIQILFVPIDKD